jgi:hypothetical protein
MKDYISESFHDLLVGELEVISDSSSTGGSHHPSRECFMAGVPEGRFEDAHNGETPQSGPNDRARERNQTPLPAQLEQLRERQKELEEARLQIEEECAELEREIGCRGDGARAAARNINWRILEDVEGPPRFPSASQNITTAMALLEGLLEQATPEERCAHQKLHTLIERATQQ